MKKLVLNLALLLFCYVGFSQSLTLEIPIIKTGQADIEIEDDNDVVIDTVTIDVSTDDAEQENDEMDSLIDDDIDAGWKGDDFKVLTAGFRFQNVTLPKGTVIDSAFIVVTSHEAKAAEDEALLEICVEDADSAETYTIDALLTDRAIIATTVTWTINEEWGLWTTHQSPDIASLVQATVDREGWVEGNAISFILKGTDEQGASELDHAREMESFENIADPEDGGDGVNHPERVPKLVIYYSGTSSINSNELASNFSVYPNPASKRVNVSLNESGLAQVKIYNAIGMVVLSETISEMNASFKTESLSKGLYHIVIDQNNKVSSQKLIVE